MRAYRLGLFARVHDPALDIVQILPLHLMPGSGCRGMPRLTINDCLTINDSLTINDCLTRKAVDGPHTGRSFVK